MKFLQKLKTAASAALQVIQTKACAFLAVFSVVWQLVKQGQFALAFMLVCTFMQAALFAATPQEQAEGLITTATSVFDDVVTFTILVTGFSLIMWVVLKIRKAK